MSRSIGAMFSKRTLTPLGARIENERLARGLALEDLSTDAEIGRNTLYRIYREPDYSPSVAIVQRVADALDVPLWRLFYTGAE